VLKLVYTKINVLCGSTTKKNKNCILTLVIARGNSNSVFGFQEWESIPTKYFYGKPKIKDWWIEDKTTEELCKDTCLNVANCMIWRFNKKNEKCLIHLVKLANPDSNCIFGFRPPTTLPTTVQA